MTNLDSVLKIRDITLPTKVCLVIAMVFPVVMYRCESWIIMKGESQRIVALDLWFWIELLRVPWTARRSNQSMLKEVNPEYSLEALGVGDGQGSLVCCSPRGHKESDMTERLN